MILVTKFLIVGRSVISLNMGLTIINATLVMSTGMAFITAY